VQGRVTNIVRVGAFVDVGAERQGLVPRNKMRSNFTSSADNVVRVGETVIAWVSEASQQKFILSLVKGKAYAPSAKRRGDPRGLQALAAPPGASDDDVTWLEGKVARMQPFGAFVAVSPPSDPGAEVQGLLHKTQIRRDFAGSVEETFDIGQVVRVRVLAAGGGRLALSMRPPSDADGAAASEEPPAEEPPVDLSGFEEVAGRPDAWLEGRVAEIASIGAFVQLRAPGGDGPEAKGLLHIRQIRRDYVADVAEELEVGQAVRVRVLDVDVAGGKLLLSMLEEPDGASAGADGAAEASKLNNQPTDYEPFIDLIGKPKWLSGVVSAVQMYGAFVDVNSPDGGEQVRGLLHKNEMVNKLIADASKELQAGQEVRVRVIAVDPKERRLSLSQRSSLSAYLGIPPERWVKGKVTRLMNYGAFVEVYPPEGIDATPQVGLLKTRNIQCPDGEPFVVARHDVGEIYEVGQEVELRILGVDVEAKEMILSTFQPGEAPDEVPSGAANEAPALADEPAAEASGEAR